jgi:hypothetical protein
MNGSPPTPTPAPTPLVLDLPSLPVTSSLLASVAYDHDRAILQLEFRGGAIYQYFGVPSRSYQELLQAESHGAYFNRHIRSFFRHALLHLASQPVAIHFPPILCSTATSPTLD